MIKKDLEDKLNEFKINHIEAEYSQRTIQQYESDVIKFINWLPNSFDLTKTLLIDFKRHLGENYQTNSINKTIVIVNKFLKYIGREDLKLKKKKVQQKTSIDDPIWDQEHKRMLRFAKKLGMDDMYLIMKIFAYTGIRVEELKEFTVENILQRSFTIKTFNKGKERTIILRNDLSREIKKYCKDNNIKTGYIFRSPVQSDKMLNLSTIWRRLKKIAGQARINKGKIHPHAWRHLFAKAAKEIGMELDEIADILGHGKIETTRIYTMTSNIEKKRKLEKIKY